MVRPTMNILTFTILAENYLGFSFYHEECYMDKKPKFNFFTVNEEYMKPLQKMDSEVRTSTDDKNNRPFLGVVLNVENRLFFAPLSSPKKLPTNLPPELLKKKTKEAKRVEKNRLTVRILSETENNRHLCNVIVGKMIPVPESQIKKVSIEELLASSDPSESKYGRLLYKEYLAINKVEDKIESTARSFYEESISKPIKKNKISYRVDLQQAIRFHDRWIERENIYKKDHSQDNKKDKSKDFSR